MSGLLFVAAAVLAAMVGSELVLRGTKLQTGLSRVLVAWAAVWAMALYPLLRYGGVGPVAFTLFWGGTFLSWFGVRSHIESSILLRMLYLLRRQPMSEAQVVEKYSSQYGQAMRVAELLRGGMTAKSGERTVVTAKGRAILRIVSRLR
jgi:hypothetical protein